MNFAILNIKTYKNLADIARINDENIRKKTYSNIDTDRTKYNRIIEGDMNYTADYKDAIKSKYYTTPDNYGRTHKEPHVKALGVILTYSPEAHIEQNTRVFNEWINSNRDFIHTFFKGAKINMILHMDETTPHIHCVIIPTTKSGKISKNEFIKNKQQLTQLQDDYAHAMERFELKRGKHTPQRENATTAKIGALQRTIEQQQNEIERANNTALYYYNVYNKLVERYNNEMNIEQIQHRIFDIER